MRVLGTLCTRPGWAGPSGRKHFLMKKKKEIYSKEKKVDVLSAFFLKTWLEAFTLKMSLNIVECEIFEKDKDLCSTLRVFYFSF